MTIPIVVRRRHLSPYWEALEARHLLSTFDISDVQSASAVLPPQINTFIRTTPDGTPLTTADNTFNIQAYLDTGTSGMVLSQETADALGITESTYNGQPVTYFDVGVGGAQDFGVSNPLYLGLAPFTPNADIENINTYQSVYNQNLGPIRFQINHAPADDLAGPLDIWGMPALAGKVIVIDPTVSNDLSQETNTFVYNPGTPYHADTRADDPGIPQTNRHVKLSYGNFGRFTEVTPAGAPGPVITSNPFIGPDPTRALDPNAPIDNTPPVQLDFGGHSSTGSFIFDTGAQASFMSTTQAGNLHVHYAQGTEGTPEARLVDDFGNDIGEQFQFPIGGIGGNAYAAGFYVDLTLPTIEGQGIRFVHAPVLVLDVSVEDPITHQTMTLDGDFGMNFLEISFNPDTFDISSGAFDWVVFDQPHGLLGLEIPGAPAVSPVVANRQLFYNHSYWNDPAQGHTDEDAIDPTKTALVDGQMASFENYTGARTGITGMMVDIVNLPAGTVGAGDFTFKVGKDDNAGGWSTLAIQPTVTVLRGAGLGGSDRVELVWPDGAVKNTWLQVTVKADSATGLATPDVFYFGSQIGETGNSFGNTSVNSGDIVAIRDHPTNFSTRALPGNPYDLNHDGSVNSADMIVARDNPTNFQSMITLITPSSAMAPMSVATSSSAARAQNPGTISTVRAAGARAAKRGHRAAAMVKAVGKHAAIAVPPVNPFLALSRPKQAKRRDIELFEPTVPKL